MSISNYTKYLWRITEGFHLTAILRTSLGVMRVGVLLAFIWFSKTAIDCATGRTPATEGMLATWFLLMVICLIAAVVMSQWGRYIEARATMRMNNRLNRHLFNILMTTPLVRGQQGFHSGDMLNRLTLDVRTISNFALIQWPAIIVMIVQLIGAFTFLAILNPYLALAPIIITPISLLASKLYFRRQRQLTAGIREGESSLHVAFQEGLKHRILLLTLGCLNVIDHNVATIQQNLDDSNRLQSRLSRISSSIVKLGFALGYLTAFGWSIFSLEAGIITFGTMTAFIQLVSRIQNPIANISGYIPAFISTSVAIDRLHEIDLSATNSDFSHLTPNFSPIKRPGIRIKNLTFRYESDGSDIISSFSHDFRPGSRTMIAGSTGAGKTTLIKLLLGLLKPDSGSIEIYNETATLSSLNSQLSTKSSPLAAFHNFAYVPQGNSLLHGTIRENLLLAAPDATESQLADALHIAAADFVFDLPHGLDTPCDEAGGGLSEGQAQRIAIARALLRPGSILLLDEFNSALDADTAALVMQRLATARPDATIIIIAHHRTAIAPYCDEVLRFEQAD